MCFRGRYTVCNSESRPRLQVKFALDAQRPSAGDCFFACGKLQQFDLGLKIKSVADAGLPEMGHAQASCWAA